MGCMLAQVREKLNAESKDSKSASSRVSSEEEALRAITSESGARTPKIRATTVSVSESATSRMQELFDSRVKDLEKRLNDCIKDLEESKGRCAAIEQELLGVKEGRDAYEKAAQDVSMEVCMYVCIYIYYIRVLYVNIHTYIYTHIHIYIYTYIYIRE
jgi:hypothetical protein